ncbi:phospholipase A2 domain-containing protein [Phlyctochytrium arcticum]|nr:phospholipase A2 domain-containing protein [Phlyctochytrium arcticum]
MFSTSSAILALTFATLSVAAPAPSAAMIVWQPTAQGQAFMLQWTQTTSSSRDQWLAARQQSAIYTTAPYNLSFATDYCDYSPDQPFGFDFRPASPANPVAAKLPSAKGQALLLQWTPPTSASRDQWLAARQKYAIYINDPYNLSFAADYCTYSPDQPLGFDFRLACARHDFGYGNYRALNQLGANKPRLDNMFYEDMKAICGGSITCKAAAFTYYTAAKAGGKS